MTIYRIYSITSIGRPVVWSVPANRAMVIVLAPAAAAGAAVAFRHGVPWPSVLGFALATALAAFGTWAMGRELDPDQPATAFSALVVSVLVFLLIGPAASNAHLLVLFTTLGLVRQVNRTTGLEARITDSLVLFALTLWVVYGTGNPLFALVAGLSFSLDGILDRPLRRQWLFAILSFGTTIVYMVDHDVAGTVYGVPHTLAQWLAAMAAVVFALNAMLLNSVTSVADVGGKPLKPARVRGGMAVAFLAVALGLPEVREVALIAATLAGVCLASAFRRSFRNPA